MGGKQNKSRSAMVRQPIGTSNRRSSGVYRTSLQQRSLHAAYAKELDGRGKIFRMPRGIFQDLPKLQSNNQ